MGKCGVFIVTIHIPGLKAPTSDFYCDEHTCCDPLNANIKLATNVPYVPYASCPESINPIDTLHVNVKIIDLKQKFDFVIFTPFIIIPCHTLYKVCQDGELKIIIKKLFPLPSNNLRTWFPFCHKLVNNNKIIPLYNIDAKIDDVYKNLTTPLFHVDEMFFL